MKELVLLVEPAKEPSVPSPASGLGQAVAHWSAWEVPEGRISLPARLHADLLAIRAEHMAWAYDLGRLRVGRKELQVKLKPGESPSMWWCSLLYERHPKMTPNLYTIYKLRALERLMDEEGFTALRLCGGDATLRHTLADFCAANHVSIGIVTVPKEAAQAVTDVLYRSGVRAFWCFAPCRLQLPPDAVIQYENLALSLAHLKARL